MKTYFFPPCLLQFINIFLIIWNLLNLSYKNYDNKIKQNNKTVNLSMAFEVKAQRKGLKN